MNRRRFCRRMGAGLMTSLASGGLPLACTERQKSGDKKQASFQLNGTDRKFLFVFAAMGGASINDSFMAVRQSESDQAATLNTFPDSLVFQAEGSELRAVDVEMDKIGFLPFAVKGNQSAFLSKHAQDIMVTSMSGKTVSHRTGQYRVITGHDAWNGRTLQEAVAAQYGQDLLMPNVNMATLGFAKNGTDPDLPRRALAQRISDPALFPFGLHGFKGIPGAPSASLMRLARETRDKGLERPSVFMERGAHDARVADWLFYRQALRELERRDLINKLNPFVDTDDTPFADFGLTPSPRGEIYREIFPNIGPDDLQNQALLAYLLVTEGLSCTVTFGLGMNTTLDGSDPDDPLLTNAPTAFDYAHNGHRGTQALLWQRTLDTIDRLITLLKATEYRPGESFWQHSMIYIATEFGRDKTREANDWNFTSGHHTNNGCVVISPLANGGKVLGGVDKETLLTYGFDSETGEPRPGTDMNERHIYAGILHALQVDTSGSGLPSMRAMRRSA